MLVMAFLTMARYKHISEFRARSRDFALVVVGDESEISAARVHLRKMTFQSVEQEDIGDGRYRLRFRCPPDSVDGISMLLSKTLREVIP